MVWGEFVQENWLHFGKNSSSWHFFLNYSHSSFPHCASWPWKTSSCSCQKEQTRFGMTRKSHPQHIFSLSSLEVFGEPLGVVTWLSSELSFPEKPHPQASAETSQEQLFTIPATWGCGTCWAHRSLATDVNKGLWTEVSTVGFERLWLLELINNFSSVSGYKVNWHTSGVFRYISNEQHESKISKTFQL